MSKGALQTCVGTGVFLHAPLADKGFTAELALELLGDVVQRRVHLQAVFVGKRLATDLAGVRPHASVVEHMDAQGVEFGQSLPADVVHECPLSACRRPVVGGVSLGFVHRAQLHRGLSDDGCKLAALLLMSSQVGTQRGGILELLATQLQELSTTNNETLNKFKAV